MDGWPDRDLLAHRIGTTPDTTALINAATGKRYTFGDVDSAVRTAVRDHFADDAAPEPGTPRPRVGIAAEPSPAFAVALFAAWRRGAVAVPLSTDTPAADRRRRFDAVGLELLIETKTARFDDIQPSLPTEVLDPTFDGEQSGGPSGATWQPDEPALVVFTSGTTGRPNGVELTHRNLVASAVGSAFRLGVDRADRWFDCLPPNHMGGLAPFVRGTLAGTGVVLERGFDADTSATAMATHGTTGVSLVPTMLRRLLDADWTPHPELRIVLCGGAPTPTPLVHAAEAANVPLYPTYGTTETASQIATATPADIGDDPRTVGSPLVTATVTIVDPETGDAVSAGDVGELVVDGPVVTPGYVDADLQTGQFGLHTGDLAVQGRDGSLRIRGRLDDAIQTGGETVHPERVVAAVSRLDGIREAAVVGVPDDVWGERIAALVVPDPDRRPSVDEVRDRLETHLAPYEVPSVIQMAESLPRTASGTVDRVRVRERLCD